MRPRATLRKPAILTRRLSSLVVRAVVITSMSFAVAFGFLAGATSPAAHYDPYMFAIGVAALFGAACGAIGILISRIRQMKAELRDLEARLDEAADRNWEIREAQERTASFFEAQDDVIVRRDGDGAITYANDASARSPAAAREDLLATAFALPVAGAGRDHVVLADGTRALRSENRRARRRPLDRLARSHRARRRRQRNAERRPRRDRPRAGRTRAGRWRATRPRRPTAPSRASSPWCRTRSARRSTAFSAWPISSATRR